MGGGQYNWSFAGWDDGKGLWDQEGFLGEAPFKLRTTVVGGLGCVVRTWNLEARAWGEWRWETLHDSGAAGRRLSMQEPGRHMIKTCSAMLKLKTGQCIPRLCAARIRLGVSEVIEDRGNQNWAGSGWIQGVQEREESNIPVWGKQQESGPRKSTDSWGSHFGGFNTDRTSVSVILHSSGPCCTYSLRCKIWPDHWF